MDPLVSSTSEVLGHTGWQAEDKRAILVAESKPPLVQGERPTVSLDVVGDATDQDLSPVGSVVGLLVGVEDQFRVDLGAREFREVAEPLIQLQGDWSQMKIDPVVWKNRLREHDRLNS